MSESVLSPIPVLGHFRSACYTLWDNLYNVPAPFFQIQRASDLQESFPHLHLDLIPEDLAHLCARCTQVLDLHPTCLGSPKSLL